MHLLAGVVQKPQWLSQHFLGERIQMFDDSWRHGD
jgi:hypothetical protein